MMAEKGLTRKQPPTARADLTTPRSLRLKLTLTR